MNKMNLTYLDRKRSLQLYRKEDLEIIPVLGNVCNKIKLLNVMKKYKINNIFMLHTNMFLWLKEIF